VLNANEVKKRVFINKIYQFSGLTGVRNIKTVNKKEKIPTHSLVVQVVDI
jgi:hypothetical protein